MKYDATPTFVMDLAEAIQDNEPSFSVDESYGLADEAVQMIEETEVHCSGELGMLETALLDLTGVEIIVK